jgi:hypothetical protein
VEERFGRSGVWWPRRGDDQPPHRIWITPPCYVLTALDQLAAERRHARDL